MTRAALRDLPIVGVGGVSRAEDAVDLLVAGAQAVQVGTAAFADPHVPFRLVRELERWCRRDVTAVRDLKAEFCTWKSPRGAAGAACALAFDVDDLVAASHLARDLKPWFGVAKVGLGLYSAVGPDAIGALAGLGTACSAT